MPVAYVGAAAGLASAVGGLVNSTSGGSSSPNATYGGNPATYIPTAQPGADQMYQAIFNQMAPYASSLPGQVIPQYQNIYSAISSNPYFGQAQTGANQAAGYAPTVAGYGEGGAAGLYGAGNSILNTAFDPQQSLYNRLQQQNVDQSNATNSMYGLGSSPYGAGVADQNLNNFNIDWQNAQLQRQQQGIQSAGQAYSGATNLGGQAATDLSTLGALPSQTYLGQQNTDLGALNSLSRGYNAAFGPQESLANLLQSYLGLGQSATGLAQQGQGQQFQQNQVTGQQLATALTNPALANLFNGSSQPNYSGQPYNFDYGTNYGYGVPNYGAGGLDNTSAGNLF